MDWGDAPTSGAVVVALGAAAVSTWQAREAKKARGAAERQATAAEAALAEMRKQTATMEHDRVARDEADGPRFENARPSRAQGDLRPFGIVMTEGPEVDVVATEVRGSTGATDLQVFVPPNEVHPRRMVRGAKSEFVLSFPSIGRTTNVEVRFECTEVGGRNRQWIRWETVRYPGPIRMGRA